MPLHHYLLLYDIKHQKLIDAIDFGNDAAAAARAYTEKEREHYDERKIEIVLLGADSLDTIRKTHPHYFDRTGTDFFTLVTAE